ncbi:MAG: LCP family protein [Syntrophomonadaceae bacterium]|nr:LCP family protein [Syntrophomonadaceae bacterium]
MKRLKKYRLILLLILSLTLVGAEINSVFPHSIKIRINRGEIINILLMGVDARPGEEQNTRSDVMVVASINFKLDKIVLLSIPRDTRIEGWDRTGKINMINQLKGPEESCKEVSRLLDKDVEYYIITNFEGFEKMIDTLGGVDMYVDIDLRSYTNGVFLEKGNHHLNGKEALTYARFRETQQGDIGRTARQQNLLKALARQLGRKENVASLPRLLSQLRENVQSNISLSDTVYLANLIPGLKEDDIINQTLPGYHYVDPYSGASYWEVDREIARSIIDSLFKGERFEVHLQAPPWAMDY